jgi:hypothetical protein
MKIHIDESVLEETQECPHDFSCLATGKCGDRTMCEVKCASGKNILVLKSEEAASCPYRMTSGGVLLCTCPTHFVIHQQQKP